MSFDLCKLDDLRRNNVDTKCQHEGEWHLFYCDSTLGCRGTQYFDLCKLDEL